MSLFFQFGILPLFLLLVLLFTARKGYGRITGVILVLTISSFLTRIPFPRGKTDPEIFVAVQIFAICLLMAGSLLRKQGKADLVLLGKALGSGSKSFSKTEILQLFSFMNTARHLVWKNSFLVGALTWSAVLLQLFTSPLATTSNFTRLDLYFVFFPIVFCMMLTEFAFRIPEYNWFKSVPTTHPLREQNGIPRYIWILPAMALLAIWSIQMYNHPPF
jgi:hypothetical protein